MSSHTPRNNSVVGGWIVFIYTVSLSNVPKLYELSLELSAREAEYELTGLKQHRELLEDDAFGKA